MRGALEALMNNGVGDYDKYRVAEIGVWRGENSLNMILTLRNKLEILYLIDHYKQFYPNNTLGLTPQANFEMAKRRLERFEHLCQWYKEDSIKAAQRFEDNSLHFVYLDGDHQYYEVIKDLEAWYPKIIPGCLLGGHDAHMDSVRFAVRHFAKRHDIEPLYFGGEWEPDWWFYK